MNLTTCFIIFCASHICGAGNTCNAQSVIKKLFLKLQSRRHETRYAPSFGLSGHFEGTVVGWPRNGCSRLSRTQARRSSSCSSREQSSDETKIHTSLSRFCHPIRSWCWPCAVFRPYPDERQICLCCSSFSQQGMFTTPNCTDNNVALTL